VGARWWGQFSRSRGSDGGNEERGGGLRVRARQDGASYGCGGRMLHSSGVGDVVGLRRGGGRLQMVGGGGGEQDGVNGGNEGCSRRRLAAKNWGRRNLIEPSLGHWVSSGRSADVAADGIGQLQKAVLVLMRFLHLSSHRYINLVEGGGRARWRSTQPSGDRTHLLVQMHPSMCWTQLVGRTCVGLAPCIIPYIYDTPWQPLHFLNQQNAYAE
jgi:hypothetical protein